MNFLSILKISLFVLCSILSVKMSLAQNQNNLMKSADIIKYADPNFAIKEPIKVVFIGNSITEGWVGASPVFFSSNSFVGRGISGQVTAQFLLRFQNDVIKLKPLAVVINGGVNDIAENGGQYNQEFTLNSIKSMAEIAKANGIKVILSSILPADKFRWRSEIQDVVKKIDTLNLLIKEYAEINSFAYIDYNSVMRNDIGGMQSMYSDDGVHPTKAGYEIMEIVAKPIISRVLGL